MFETASFHIVKPCNMKCKFCYATFEDMHVGPQLPLDDARTILKRLKDGGLDKITFAGGEPLLYKYLTQAIIYSKEIGLTTSIITNGSLLTDKQLKEWQPFLDWIGVSIDSLNDSTNRLIGRMSKSLIDPYTLVDKIKRHGYKLKINTVVNKYNENEDMSHFIQYADPERWKIFDTLRVEGQNDKEFENIKSSPGSFDRFISRHNHVSMVPENNDAMTGSYLLIDPLGRLFENSSGKHTYSEPLQNSTLDNCLSQINLNRYRFIERGGIYNW